MTPIKTSKPRSPSQKRSQVRVSARAASTGSGSATNSQTHAYQFVRDHYVEKRRRRKPSKNRPTFEKLISISEQILTQWPDRVLDLVLGKTKYDSLRKEWVKKRIKQFPPILVSQALSLIPKKKTAKGVKR